MLMFLYSSWVSCRAASTPFLLFNSSDSDSRLCLLVGLLQLEFASKTLVLTVFADSGAAASDDLALDLASSAGRARLLQRIRTRGGGGGSSAR
jgi:hypothetical protein